MKSKTKLLAFALFVAAQACGDSSAIAQGTKLTIGIGGINPGTSLSFIAIHNDISNCAYDEKVRSWVHETTHPQ